MAYTPYSSSVVTFQSDPTKLLVHASVSGTLVPHSVSGVGVFNVAGSVATTGSVTALQGTNPWVIANSSVMLATGTNMVGSVTAIQGTNPYIVQLSSGSVITATGNSSVQVVGLMPAQSVSGVGLFNVNHTGNGSILANLQNSSVAVLQGTNPWTVTGVTSISGGFVRTEDNPHATGDVGLFVLAVRNDSTSSFVSANQDYSPIAVDSAGRPIIKVFASDESQFEFTTSTVSTSVTLAAPSVTGKRSYITDFWFANTGSVATLITFKDGSTSVVGYTIAPAGGGSNSPGIAMPLRTNPSQDLTFQPATATSILYATIKGYQAP